MYILYKQDGEVLYGIKDFLLDSVEDVKNLPTNARPGSAALIIPTGDVYVLNSDKKWVLFGNSASDDSESGDDSSTGNCDCEDILNIIDANQNGLVDGVELLEF